MDQAAFKTRTRAVISLAASLLAACAPHAPPEAKLPVVDVTSPLKRSIIERDTYPGRFDAVDSVDIRPRVGGFIDAVLFKDGELVHKGDILFRIDPRPYAAAVEQAAAQVAAAKSQLLLANQELDRAKTLIATSTIAPELLERRHQSAQAAAAAIQVSQAALFRARLDLSFCQVIAPMTGRISRHLVSVGNLVEAGGGNGTLLTTIVSIDPIDFYFDIDEKSYLRYAALVQQGQRRTVGGEGTEVRIRLPGEKIATHEGTLDFVDNRLDRSTGTLRVRARIGNQDSTLSPGQFGRAELISASAHPALLVPNIALVTQPTGKALDVVGSDNKVTEREVILGGLFGAWREIRAGLKSDDRILVAGFQQAQVGSAERQAEAKAAVLTYQYAVLTAVREVETSLASISRDRERTAFLTLAASDATKAADQIRQAWTAGESPILDVLEADRARFAAEAALADSQASERLDRATLFAALGGSEGADE